MDANKKAREGKRKLTLYDYVTFLSAILFILFFFLMYYIIETG